MDDNKIEEMAKIMCGGCIENELMTCSFTHEEIPCDFAKNFAEALYNEGYRKESDTAREILECLRFLIEERNCVGGYDLEDETIDGTIFVEILNELKERYGVEVE